MQLHPTRVRWFEASVPTQKAVYALDALAGAEIVQLEEQAYRTRPSSDVGELHRYLKRFDQTAARYARELPKDDLTPQQKLEPPAQLAAEVTRYLRAWCARLARLRRKIRDRERERGNLVLLDECLVAMHGTSEHLDAIRHSTPFLYKNIFVCAKGQLDELAADAIVNEIYQGDRHDFWIAAGEPIHKDILEGTATLLDCRPVRLPEWFPAGQRAQHQQILDHLKALDRSISELKQDLMTCHADPGIREAMADRRVLRWSGQNAIDPMPEHDTVRIIGWTTALTPAELRRILEDVGIDARVEFGNAPAEFSPPVILSASRRVRPFQLFVRLLGTPGQNEIDPTPLLSILVPLLFGFMFPDLGHGLVLALFGVWYSRRVPDALVLVYCGLAAAVFGLFFGEFFGIRDLLPAICGCPLDHPVEILIATLLLGVGLMLLGLCFSGVEAYWRGEFGTWLMDGAPVLLLYLSVASAALWREAAVVIVIALAWYVAGIVVLCRESGLRCVGARLGHLLQSAFQLTVNTLSFMRIGAFALGHSAFSVVVSELMQSTHDAIFQAVIFVLGHMLIIVLEGLIVMVQTSRLILFEFFIRFLRFDGRIFQPLERANPVVGKVGSRPR